MKRRGREASASVLGDAFDFTLEVFLELFVADPQHAVLVGLHVVSARSAHGQRKLWW